MRGGPAQLNENLCRELNRLGHDAQIISYSLQYPSFLFPGTSQFEQGGEPPPDIRIHSLINTVNPLSWYHTARFIRNQKPDFILIRYWLPFFGPSLGTIARLVKKHTCVLALTDNVIPHEKRAGDKRFTRYFLRGCHGFLSMSRAVLSDLKKFTASPNKAYAPHPMYETYGEPVSRETARKKLGITENDRVVLFFGLIRKYKGLDILLEAMDHPRLKELDVKLLVAGEFYEDKTPYLEMISKHDLGGRVLLHDHFIANDEVKYYFCAANLVAQTYRHATNSGVTMVAYFYAKPMLVTDVGGLAEIVPHDRCGYVVDPSPKQIGDSMADYFINHRETEFSANVAAERKKYEWESFIGTLISLYGSASRKGH